MKVTNWRRKIIASIVAGGALGAGAAYAVDIPLGDPSFEAYVVPASPGYAYAAPPYGSYRPTSPWVDDLDSPPGYTQDDGDSNWLYDAAYGESSTLHRRPAPRTGNQAMHGLENYNQQVVTDTFAAEKIYTFSIFAQGDIDASGSSSRVWLYLFDASKPFTEPGSLQFKRFAPDTGDFVNRAATDTPAQSQAKWTQISLSHTVFPGESEIGKPIGVGFWIAGDGAVDDAKLEVDDAINHLFVMEVNTTNGQVRFRNQTGAAVSIDYYDVSSTSGALNTTGWSSLQDQNMTGFPAGDGSGNGWEEAGGSSTTSIGESFLTGSSPVGNNVNVGLGAAFNVGGAQDLVFQYGAFSTPAVNPDGDYNNNGIVDAADYVLWRNGGPLSNDPTPGVQPGDYDLWRANFGQSGAPTGPSTLTRGLVHYVTSFPGLGAGGAVPEPSSVILVGIGIALLAAGGWRRTSSDG